MSRLSYRKHPSTCPKFREALVWLVQVVVGYNENLPSTHPSYPASVIVWVVIPSELPGILVSVPDTERKESMAKSSEQKKRSKTARREARKTISDSSTQDNPAFDDEDGSLEMNDETKHSN